MYPHNRRTTRRYWHTRYVSYNSSSVCTRSNPAERSASCGYLLLQQVCTGQGLARARSVVSLSTPGYGQRVFCTGTFCFRSVRYFFFQINQNQPWNFLKNAYKQQQRYSVGTISEDGCIISAVVQQCDLMRGSWSCCCIWSVFNETNGLAKHSSLDILHHVLPYPEL